MRFFAILAFAVAFAAASGCGESNCTRDILNECTPAFQFDNADDCYFIDLAIGEIWVIEDLGGCNQSATFDKAAATLFASSSSFNITDNALTYEGAAGTPTCDDSPAPRRKTVPFTYLVTFAYAEKASSSDPIVQEDTCVKTITLLTDYPTCGGNEPKGSGRSNRASGRRNSASGRRNSASGGSRRNSASTNENGDDRREGCATSPLFGLNVSATPCQTGQCCGSNFCYRDQHYGDCVARGDGITNPGFLPGSACADTTCTPKYPGSGSGKGGSDVSLGSSLKNAGDAVPAGGALEVEVLDVNEGGDLPAGAVTDQAVVAFQVNRFEVAGDAGTQKHGYLSDGTWIEVTVESEALNGADIAVFRYDEDTSAWINAAEDCVTTKSDVQIEIAGTVYTVPICHTSQFVVTLAADGDDKDDKKGKAVKVTKKAKPSKKGKTAGATATKAPKTVAKKEAGKKKTAVAIGVGIAGAAVATAGVAFLAKRRSNKKGKAPASPATAEIAVVSV